MPRTSHRVADLVIAIPADLAQLHDARDRFARWFDRWAVDEVELRDDLLVVLSELLANGIAAAPDGAEVVLRACHAGGDVLIEVSNPVAPWIEPADRWDLRDPLRGGGRGLLIVRALVDDIEVVHDVVEHETTVRCRRAAFAD